MEIKINREIRNYTESMFFGLSMRQFIFAVIGCGMAVGMYFILKPFFGVETLSLIPRALLLSADMSLWQRRCGQKEQAL